MSTSRKISQLRDNQRFGCRESERVLYQLQFGYFKKGDEIKRAISTKISFHAYIFIRHTSQIMSCIQPKKSIMHKQMHMHKTCIHGMRKDYHLILGILYLDRKRPLISPIGNLSLQSFF
jgi:hypothetical protein